jgi:AcrR family transcriptional regulator
VHAPARATHLSLARGVLTHTLLDNILLTGHLIPGGIEVVEIEEAGAEPRWRRRSDARPAEIAEAALELFVEHGFAATRMEAIAKRAGVTKGTVYLYFPSKEDLFRAVVKENILPNLEQGERLVAEHTGSAAELLALLVRRSWELMQTSRTQCMPKLMLAEGKNFPELAKF